MQYRYVKAKHPNKKSKIWQIIPTFLFTTGLFLLVSAASPIFYYQFFYAPSFEELATPVSEDFLTLQTQPQPKNAVLGETVQNVDLSQASNWFPGAPRFLPRPSKITHYTLSIPKLKIKNAVVEINGENLKKSLIQYPGTALPGQFGNTVIFGHSTLPNFFNPKNYTTIFSTLPTIIKDSEVLVDFDGVSYRYVVEEMVEVKPDDISVLEQRFDDTYLTLVTCVPPGTYLRRLVVRARLQPL